LLIFTGEEKEGAATTELNANTAAVELKIRQVNAKRDARTKLLELETMTPLRVLARTIKFSQEY
jgi:hypothetical protein